MSDNTRYRHFHGEKYEEMAPKINDYTYLYVDFQPGASIATYLPPVVRRIRKILPRFYRYY
jgi:hypothetical protein